MSETTGIQWTEATWNPWHGCIKVSSGCKNCYMYREKKRYGQDPTKVVRSKTKFNEPLKWKDGRLIFTCSWSDWFIEQADEWRAEAWDVIRRTPQHTYQILTKRPEHIAEHLPKDWGHGWPNVWLGFSAETQDYFDNRIEIMNKVPAATKFISIEPQIEAIDANHVVDAFGSLLRRIDWVICGGESGTDARPFFLEWARDLRDQCAHTEVPFFLKQLGSNAREKHMNGVRHPTDAMMKEGWKLLLKDSHGGDPAEWPEDLRVREMPVVYP